MLLYCLILLDLSKKDLSILNTNIILISIIQILFGLSQWFMTHNNDSVKGSLIGMGAGHHVMGAIAGLMALYVFSKRLFSPKIRYGLIILFLSLIYFSDSKQIVLAFLIAWGLFLLISSSSTKILFSRLLVFISSSTIIILLSSLILPFILEGSRWTQGFAAKFNVFDLIIHQYHSIINFFIGLGPGHTVGRLAFMIPTYSNILLPLGATYSTFTDFIWEYQQGFWLTNSGTGSSLFSPFFSWAGLFGDLGFIGLFIYFIILYLSFRNLNFEKMNTFLFLLLIVFGFIFGWLEEPNFMCFFVVLLFLFSKFKVDKTNEVNKT